MFRLQQSIVMAGIYTYTVSYALQFRIYNMRFKIAVHVLTVVIEWRALLKEIFCKDNDSNSNFLPHLWQRLKIYTLGHFGHVKKKNLFFYNEYVSVETLNFVGWQV